MNNYTSEKREDWKLYEEEISKLNGLFEILSKINHILVRVKSSEELFRKTCEIIVEHEDFRLAWVGKNNTKTFAVKPVAYAGEPAEYVNGLVIFSDERPEGLGPTGTAVREGRTVVCNNFFANPYTLPWRDNAKMAHIKSSAVVPFKFKNCIYGSLNVYASKTDFFQKKEMKLLEEIALCLSFGLGHLEEERKRKQAEEKFRKINSVLENIVMRRTQELRETNIILEEEIKERQRVENELIKLNCELEDKVCTRTKELEEKNAILDKSNTLFSAILESSPEIIVFSLDNNYCYTAFNKRHKETMLQIWGKEIKIGMNMLEVISRQDDYYKAKASFDKALSGASFVLIEEYGDEKLSRLFWQDYFAPIYSNAGKIVGLTCFVLNITEQKQAEKRNLYLSYHDELTGLYNRRFCEEQIKKLDTEKNLPISIILGDVNGLKLVNDAFGHAKGDELLYKAADVIKSACRNEDVVARWGGDEFVILLPKTTMNEAEEIVKKIKNEYSNEYINAVRVSISLGWDTKVQDNQDILEILKSAEDYMYKHKIVENENTRGSTIKTIINTLHEKNPREELHSKRVSEICQNIGKVIGLSEIEVARLKTVGLLHDIGKIAIEESILNKNGKLTEQERMEINRHPDIGYRILTSSYGMSELANCVLSHHERWDGKGYPNGIKGEEIPLIARIIAVADTYDAMTSERAYRKALSEEVAVSEIIKNAGTQFDPEIAKVFIRKVLNKSYT